MKSRRCMYTPKNTPGQPYHFATGSRVAKWHTANLSLSFVPEVDNRYSITSSARSRNASGIVRPSALAVV
ncbi:MAG: hypothetical protein WCB52_05075, partial [Pseudolabrys sp.]